MYLDYYNLERKPFTKTPDASLLYPSPAHLEALARLEQAVEDRELMVLTGDVGCGKTTLSRALIDRLPSHVLPALIINPRLTPNQLLRAVCKRLGEDNPKHYRADLIEQIHELLFSYYEKDMLPLLLVDEAQSIPNKETFEELRLLTNFQLDDRNLMAIIIMGQPELLRRLRHPSFESFRQRVGLWYHLGPLNPEQVGEYIGFRLERTGRKEPLFTDGAVVRIAALSGGIPRWINNIAASAMLMGFAEGEDSIGPRTIDDVASDLGLAEGGVSARVEEFEPARGAEEREAGAG